MREILLGLLGFVLSFVVLAADGGSIAATSPPFVVINLGTLGGTYSEPHDSGSALNASGQIVGASTTTSGEFHAFLWSPQDGMIDLGTLGGLYSYALAINTGYVQDTCSW
jgi:probable HAF family extracellular repeat protein